MSAVESIVVVLATHNRANVLDSTLDAFAALSTEGLRVRFRVVDNNSTDATRDIVLKHAGTLAVEYVFEGKPGKNAALNTALRDMEPADVVVFTDDDIVPDHEWLVKIASAARRHPQFSVFGGRVELLWPQQPIPHWASTLSREPWAFAAHDLGPEEVAYPGNRQPAGPNYWVRWRILESGFRFDETIGPRPTNRIMGSETSFLLSLRTNGFDALFVPDAVVRHRVDTRLLGARVMIDRAFTSGRGGARLSLMRKRPAGRPWRLGKSVKAILGRARWWAQYALVSLIPNADKRTLAQIRAMRGVGWHYEMTRIWRSSGGQEQT